MVTKDNKNQNKKFNSISIGFSSPDSILNSSSGEVLKPETINYRTYKPERDGLFCERIFGPTKDFECACGKYRRIRYRSIVCDRCGVEVTEKEVRRSRTGHINLVVPVAHVWYFRSLPNKIGYLLGVSTKELNMIIYYERYVVIQPGIAKDEDGESLHKMQFLNEQEYSDVLDRLPPGNLHLEDNDSNKFIAKMGAECLIDLLDEVDVDALSKELRECSKTTTSAQKKKDLLKRLKVIDAFRKSQEKNKLSWMVLKTIPVIPPELRPLVPLDGGRFATSDLNDLYRRVIIRNNRLKKMISINAPDLILRNEKRMLQESVDALFDNANKSVSMARTDANRPLKSLADYLKGKQGRFRQNLLGKRVDYSARSVIVGGPELKMHQCGLPKEMAAELYKPFVTKKLIERGIVKTPKSAKKFIDRKDPVVWEILENALKGHPVLLNRAPTLHRLGIQAFQPHLIEGKAIQLHPLVCSAFNADFDGDQMAVHLPLGPEAILESQLLLLASHNILNPANGSPVTVPSQDMVLGLYYMTKERLSIPDKKIKGEGLTFYAPEELTIAYNEKKVDLNASIKVRTFDIEEKDGKRERVQKVIKTTAGRVLFNEVVPDKVGYINEVLNKKNLRGVISKVLKYTDMPTASKFLDEIKDMGFKFAFQGGLSFSLGDIIIPDEKEKMINEAGKKVDDIVANYEMGVITNQERYNQVVDLWSVTNKELTELSMKLLREDKQGFNSVYMMLDSGARGSREQIRQLTGMRGLMAKPKKSMAGGGEIIENPIVSNFKEGLSILEYFISTHGARKGLADTALKTADAGYLTRRLVDVAQDVIIKEKDCGTLRGISVAALIKNDEVIEPISDRIFGRFALEDVFHPKTRDLIVAADEIITLQKAKYIEDSNLEKVQIRSPLSCEADTGVCVKCYGQNLATNRIVQEGEAIGVVAAQSIGEPGTQLTLRTFHVGGVAGGGTEDNRFIAKYSGKIMIDDLVTVKNKDGREVVISRGSDVKILNDEETKVLQTFDGYIPYGAHLFVTSKDIIKKDTVICEWDPFDAVIISEFDGKVVFSNLIKGTNYRVDKDEQTGLEELVIIESKDRKNIPELLIQDTSGNTLRSYGLPLNGRLIIEDGKEITRGEILVKIPRIFRKSGDITGGLPRVTELFEARNPSNPAVVSQAKGVVSYGAIKNKKRQIIVTTKGGDEHKYQVPLSSQIIVQEGDFVKVGTSLSEGVITPADILRNLGPEKVQNYLINEIQDVYRLQGVKINDKHFEVIVRQMMKKVRVLDMGDTDFLEEQLVDKAKFIKSNNDIFGKKVITVVGGSDKKEGAIISLHELREQNALLKSEDKELIKTRDAVPAIAEQVLQGISKIALNTKSFISAASFQETTKVLHEAALSGKIDKLEGLKENVIVGKRIPAGTGVRKYEDIIVGVNEKIELIG